ncbi:ACT domain protein [Methanobrevibacter cuticularis]|uniref:ACT domain protein n=2 Tax=Methanobrevibacter cuticularis TaxID=47311 RepID=A0A166DQT4_9EURY|nr:ACT domain protein [Methanobrevibacter cuticularis]
MKIKQLSIFLENKKGRLWKALDILDKGNINIRALSIADTSDFGILRILVQNPGIAKELLESNNFIVKIIDIIGIELDDTPGGLSRVLKVLNDNDINLEYIYAFTHEKTEKAILLLQSEDLDLLIKTLKTNDLTIVPPTEVYNL